MVYYGFTYFKGMRLDDVSVLSFDLETTTLDPNDKDAKVLLISNTYKLGDKVVRQLFAYDDYPSEKEMIEDWSRFVKEMNPSVILGHNIFSFDLQYLKGITERCGINLDLGREGGDSYFDDRESKFRVDGTRFLHYNKYHCYGREVIDTMFLAYKYDIGRKYESYGLKKIIAQEGLEKKDRVFYDASQIRFNYTNKEEWVKIKEYCKDDSDDSLTLYFMMMPAYFYATQSIPKTFQSVILSASGSQVNSMMVRSYLQDKHSIPKASDVQEYEGAISFGNPGIYKNVFKIDVASLYPSIMIEYNVFNKFKDPKENFLTIVKYFTEERLKNKKLAADTKDSYYKDMEQAQKIFINSAYGFLGAAGLNFNSPYHAAFVTKKGREILTKAIEWAERGKGYTIVNADTDSISFNCAEKPLTKEDRVAIIEEVNQLYPERIKFTDDGYYDKVIVFKAKNYVLWDGKKVKYKGSAIKATTLEPALKEFLNKMVSNIINDNNNFVELYNNYAKEIVDIHDIKRWATRKTISDKTLNSERTNEGRIMEAIEGTEYVEGDRIYVYFKTDKELSIVEKFDGTYDKDTLYSKLHKAAKRFETVMDISNFPNYKLKKNKELLDTIIKS
jgi:DNA polymerase elongation subunit (family B)